MNPNVWTIVSVVVAIAIALVIVTFAVIVALKLATGKIDITYLLAEPGDPTRPSDEEPKASIARFQFLIFTFVIAGIYLVLCLESGQFVEIPQNAILLLGVSGTSYAASKGIRAAADTSRTHAIANAAAQTGQPMSTIVGSPPPPPPPPAAV